MKMADIRRALHQLAFRHPDPGDEALLHYLAEATRRRRPLRKAPRRCEPKITRGQVIGFFAARPYANNQDAAEFFGVNTRAVSNAFRGFKT